MTFHGFLKIPDLFHIIFLATQVRQLATFCGINSKKGFPIFRLELERALRERVYFVSLLQTGNAMFDNFEMRNIPFFWQNISILLK